MIDAEKLVRFKSWMQARQLDGALLSNPFSVAWLCDYEMPIQHGPSPFDGSTPVLYVEGDEMTLIVADSEEEAASALGMKVQVYRSYTVHEPMNPVAYMGEALAQVVKSKRNFGVERDNLSTPLAANLDSDAAIIDGEIARLRAVKTADEIARIRKSLELCDLAQQRLCEVVRAGATEIELWNDVVAAMEQHSGSRLPLLADFVGGLRTAEIGGPPGANRVHEGQWILADIVPRLNNYWGDICNVAPIGNAPQVLRDLHAASLHALETAKAMIAPGVLARDVDAATRAAIAQKGYEPYPHHTGHGIGVSYHEAPRLVPYNDEALEENMVIAIEPGVYVPDVGGVRLEDVVLVTRNGFETLTQHSKNLP